MDDIKIIFYIVAGVLYFIYQLSTSKKKENKVPPFVPESKPKPVQKTQAVNPVPKRSTVLSHEIKKTPITPKPKPVPAPTTRKPSSLEELLAEFNQQPTYTSQETIPPTVVDYEENIEDEEAQIERIKAEHKKAAEEMRNPRIQLKDEHLDPYVLKQKKKNQYASMLGDKKSLKNAFILSEIFNRKYS